MKRDITFIDLTRENPESVSDFRIVTLMHLINQCINYQETETVSGLYIVHCGIIYNHLLFLQVETRLSIYDMCCLMYTGLAGRLRENEERGEGLQGG